MKTIPTILLVILGLVASSCAPDCKDITIQVADWQTRYEDYWVEKDSVVTVNEMIDTTVSYKIEKYYTKKKYYTNSEGKETGSTCTHYITIRNTNETYSNRFAIRIEGKDYNETKGVWQDMAKSTNYVTIYPNNTHTFRIDHSAWWHNRASGYSEDDVTLHILQYSNYVETYTKKITHLRRKQTRRIDYLVTKDTVVNNCDCDIDALKAKNKAVTDVFELLKSQNLIQTN
ncbi:MAG: hypothetical protein IJK07_04335 [Bacteroidales bacterium]|nr:hypothetical protein [Bacteroidales bacterium]